MRLGDKLPVFAKDRNNESDMSYTEHIINDSSSADTDERIYSSLGEKFAKPDVIKTLRLALSVILLVISATLELSVQLHIFIQAAAILIIGYDIVINAIKDIQKRIFMRESLFVAVAAIASFCIGRGAEAIIALLLLQFSYIIRDYALFRTRHTICDSLEPQIADFQDRSIGVDSENDAYSVGDTIEIVSGMSTPTDCIISEGNLTADFSFTTGDSSPVSLGKGDYLPAYTKCLEGQAVVRVCDLSENSLYKKTADILKSGYGKMTVTERKWTVIAELIVLFALIVSFALLILLPLVFDISIKEALRRVITIVAIASPCGVLFSIPISYFAVMAEAKRSGVVFRDACALDNSAQIKSVVFNKVGTLTEKNYTVTDIRTDKMDSATFLKVAAYAESKSKSSVAKAIIAAYGGEISNELVRDFVEYPGKGVSVNVDGIRIVLGNSDFISESGVTIPDVVYEGGAVHMTVNGIYAGRIALNETVEPDTPNVLKKLYSAGIDRIAMVSGDGRARDREVSTELGINEYFAECSPQDKVLRIEEMKDRIDSHSTLAFVGGCDCTKPLFDAADVGISINSIACHSNLPQADVMIMSNTIKPIPSIIYAGKKANRFILLGVLFGCFFKLIIMTMAAIGIAPLWFGLLIDICVSFVAVILCAGEIPILSKLSDITNFN